MWHAVKRSCTDRWYCHSTLTGMLTKAELTSRAEYLSVAHLPANNEACDTWSGWVHGRLDDHRRLQVWSACCPGWPLCTYQGRHRFAPVCDGDGLRSGDKAVRVFPDSLRNTACDHICALTSEATASLPASTDNGDADESASLPAKRAKMDSQCR